MVANGEKCFTFALGSFTKTIKCKMIRFTGDHPAKVDARGRIFFPSGLVKDLPNDYPGTFFIKTDVHDKYLNVYTEPEWEIQAEIVEKRMNLNNPRHRQFLRSYYKGVTKVSLDGNGRILLPKSFLEYAEIEKEVMILGRSRMIEIWSKENFEKADLSQEELQDMALEFLGDDIPYI